MKKMIFLMLLPLTMGSCATLFSGAKDPVMFKTNVPAEVYIDGNYVGKSNETIKVRRKFKNDRQVILKSDGYEDDQFNMECQMAGAFVLNIFLGVLPCLIDIATGAAIKPSATYYERSLKPKG